jgi:uncharacterized membrane protein
VSQLTDPPPPLSAVTQTNARARSWTLSLGEWIIKRLPLVKHIYSASKQVSVCCAW